MCGGFRSSPTHVGWRALLVGLFVTAYGPRHSRSNLMAGLAILMRGLSVHTRELSRGVVASTITHRHHTGRLCVARLRGDFLLRFFFFLLFLLLRHGITSAKSQENQTCAQSSRNNKETIDQLKCLPSSACPEPSRLVVFERKLNYNVNNDEYSYELQRNKKICYGTER